MKLFSEETLSHYGIQGQKKGIRRWQYPDGRFNEEGKIRYGYKKADSNSGYSPDYLDVQKDVQKYLQAKMNYGKGAGTQRKLTYAEIKDKMKDSEYKKTIRKSFKARGY